jgi:peptide-methionine (S)-S-oxide reductase
MEPAFDAVKGVLGTVSGYTGGDQLNPTYEEVSGGGTGHTEAVEVLYDAEKVTYEELLEVFWRNIDPTTPDRQFCDVGSQYRSAIFYHDEKQKGLAEASRDRLEESGSLPGPVVTEILPAEDFYPAEEYHQDYYLKNPESYKRYRRGCGRDRRLEELWGQP